MRTRPRAHLTAALCGLCLCALHGAAQAERTTATAPGTLSTQARLDFTINIGKFIYLQVGTTGATINTVGFALTPSIPAVPTTPVGGNSRPVTWNGAAPDFVVTPSGNVLPVTVRSNAGQVTLRVTAGTPPTSGANTIALSQITVGSSDAGLPAPPLDGSSSVNVSGTSSANLVTERSANWTFSYAPTPATSPVAGVYTGQVTFTASAP